MLKHCLGKNIFSSNQSGFKPGDSYISQVIAITRDIFNGFHDRLEIRGVSLDISKAFDKVWHEVFVIIYCNY